MGWACPAPRCRVLGGHQPEIRARICDGLGWAGLDLDAEVNRRAVGEEARINSAPSSRLGVWVIPADEEAVMARDAWRALSATRA